MIEIYAHRLRSVGDGGALQNPGLIRLKMSEKSLNRLIGDARRGGHS